MYFAMARDGVFFRSLAGVHPRFGTPAPAVAVSAAWAMLLALSGTFEQRVHVRGVRELDIRARSPRPVSSCCAAAPDAPGRSASRAIP